MTDNPVHTDKENSPKNFGGNGDNLCDCLVIDPCGCFVDPCACFRTDERGCYTDCGCPDRSSEVIRTPLL